MQTNLDVFQRPQMSHESLLIYNDWQELINTNLLCLYIITLPPILPLEDTRQI